MSSSLYVFSKIKGSHLNMRIVLMNQMSMSTIPLKRVQSLNRVLAMSTIVLKLVAFYYVTLQMS